MIDGLSFVLFNFGVILFISMIMIGVLFVGADVDQDPYKVEANDPSKNSLIQYPSIGPVLDSKCVANTDPFGNAIPDCP